MTIIADDFLYSTTSSGKQIKYGEAGDCYSTSKENCRKGKFKIDLTGTGFRLKVSLTTTLYPYPVYVVYVLHFLDRPLYSLLGSFSSFIVVGLLCEGGKGL